MSRQLQLKLHAAIRTAAATLDLPLAEQHLEGLAVELTPTVAALLAEADAVVAELEPVAYTLSEAAGAVERHVSEYAGCMSSIHPDVAEDSPAALLALELRQQQSDLTATDIPAAAELALTVRPQSLSSWRWWTDRMAVTIGSIRRQGEALTGTGHYGEVTVHLRGESVGRLLDEQSSTRAAARLQDVLAGHPW